MRIRAAQVEDAPALGRVMVTSWLSAHRGQMPDAAWQKRVAEWTPEVSARAWARLLDECADDSEPRVVLLVADDDNGDLVALALGRAAEGDTSGLAAQLDALYVLPDQQGRGIGRWLLREAASELATLGFARLLVGVLTANLPARAFYEAMGGREVAQRSADEEGYPLPETVYAWDDIAALGGPSAPA